MSDSVARLAPLPTGFPRQEYWSGLVFPSPGDLPNPGIEPRSPALQADSLPAEPPGKTRKMVCYAKSLQSCPTLCDPIDGSPPGSRPWDSPGKSTGVGSHFLLHCMKVKRESEVSQLCPTLSDPMDCSPPGSSVHGIVQARVLQWIAISFSRGSSQPRNQTRVSCIAGRCFTI